MDTEHGGQHTEQAFSTRKQSENRGAEVTLLQIHGLCTLRMTTQEDRASRWYSGQDDTFSIQWLLRLLRLSRPKTSFKSRAPQAGTWWKMEIMIAPIWNDLQPEKQVWQPCGSLASLDSPDLLIFPW